ncbi:HAD family hydrolase [Azospirillum doebereinerae]
MSFDIFDTLLLRRVETPALVFDEVGRRARHAGLIGKGVTPPLFRLARQEAERRARRAALQARGTQEVDLGEIYSHLAVREPSARTALELAALELAVETKTVFANPLLLDGLHELAARGRLPVLLSDMYLPPAALRGLLRSAGIEDRLYRALYVSCAHGCSKQDGGLYRVLLADHPEIAPERVLHVGDDPVGDVAMARANGLRAVLYAPSPRYSVMRERERSLAGLAALTPPPRRLAALAGLDDDPADAFWLDFGSFALGPAVVDYCRWVVEDCRRRGIGLIAPLMREAALFAPLMQDWIRHRGYDIRVEPVFISRQALAPLELGDLDSVKARSILSARPHLSWDRLLRMAGGTPPIDLAAFSGLPLEGLIGSVLANGDALPDRILALFDAPALRDAAAARAAETRTLASAYLADRLGGTAPVALVDLGARGSTPAAIVRLAGNSPRFHTYLCYAVSDLAGPISDGLDVSVFCGESDAALALGRILYRSPQIIERALTGLSGTTLGYRHDPDGRSVPETAPVPAAGEEARVLRLLQAGIRRYAETLIAAHPPDSAWPLPAGESALFPLAAALSMPTGEEAHRLGQLRYDYNDGTGLERGINDDAAMAGVRPLSAAEDAPTMAMALGLRPLQVPWPQGALTRLDDGVFQRHIDALGMELSHGAVCRALAARVRSKGWKRVAAIAVGGDKGMGPDFIRCAAEAGLELVGYADLMDHLAPPPRFHGTPVLPLDGLPSMAVPVVLVTLGYADRLASLLRDRFATAGQPLRLVAVGRPDLEEGI